MTGVKADRLDRILHLGVFRWTYPMMVKMVVRPIAKLSEEARSGQAVACPAADYFKINMIQPAFKITFGTFTRAGCPSPDTRPSGEL